VIDVGPSSSILNQLIVMGSDCILPASFANFHSISSADGLLKAVLPKWFAWLEDFMAYQTNNQNNLMQAAKPYLWPAHKPKILPFLISSLRPHTRRVTKYTSKWIAVAAS
jgi:hypothetical protein